MSLVLTACLALAAPQLPGMRIPLPPAPPTAPMVSGPTCVASIAALKALTPPAPGAERCIRVLGYHARGDGGGGEFYWDGTSTIADDGGLVIRPQTNPAAGRWIRLVEGPRVSIAWFGATPDDGTDDRAAIQAAIDHGQEVVSSTAFTRRIKAPVYVPPGEYHVSSTLRILDGVDLYGDDANACRIKHTGSGDLLRIENLDIDGDGDPDPVFDVTVRRLGFEGNGAVNGQSSQTRFGIFLFHGVRSCSLEDLIVTRCQQGVFLRRCYTASVVGCTVMFCSVHTLKWENATAGRISRCRFDVAPNGSHCVFITFDFTNNEETLGLLVDSSSFQGSALAGLYCRDVGNLTVNSCFFENNNRSDQGFGALHLEDVAGQPVNQQENVVNVVGGFFTPGPDGGPSSRAVFVENTMKVNLMGLDVRGSRFQYAVDARSNVGAVNLLGCNFHGRPRNIAGGVEVNEIGTD